MDCKEVRQELLENYSSELSNQNITAHILQCSKCKNFANYEDILRSCFDKLKKTPPEDLERSILDIPYKYSNFNNLNTYYYIYNYITSSYERIAITGAILGFILALIINPFSLFNPSTTLNTQLNTGSNQTINNSNISQDLTLQNQINKENEEINQIILAKNNKGVESENLENIKSDIKHITQVTQEGVLYSLDATNLNQSRPRQINQINQTNQTMAELNRSKGDNFEGINSFNSSSINGFLHNNKTGKKEYLETITVQKVPYGLIPPSTNEKDNQKYQQETLLANNNLNRNNNYNQNDIQTSIITKVETTNLTKDKQSSLSSFYKIDETKLNKKLSTNNDITFMNSDEVIIVKGKPLFDFERVTEEFKSNDTVYQANEKKHKMASLNTNSEKNEIQSENKGSERLANENRNFKKPHELVEYILNSYSNSIAPGWLDINDWVVKKWISVKERIFIAPPTGYRWYAEKLDGKWVVSLKKYSSDSE